MSIRASVGFALLLCSAACAGRSGIETRPIKPEDGPRGTIHASMSGPTMYRQLDASFRLDEPGYALVGHLGGDGMIRVIYPTSPADRENRIAARTWIRTEKFDAPYDFAPQRYTFAAEPIRGPGAEMDSYDGRGHGFVFMIVSHQPLNVAPLMDGFEFGELDVKDYGSMRDPRLAVRRVADAIAGPDNYTLKFANAFSTYNYASAFGRGGCSAFSSVFGRRHADMYRQYGMYSSYSTGWYDDLDVFPIFWGSSLGMPMWYAAPWYSRHTGRCGTHYALNHYRFFHLGTYTVNPTNWAPGPTGATVPRVPLTPTITRLRPTIGDSARRAAQGGRSAIDRHTIVTRSTATTPAFGATLRPSRRATGGSPIIVRESPPRTHATSFDRPGSTRVLDERLARRTYSSPYGSRSARQGDSYSDWLREPRSTSTASSGSSGSPASSAPSSTAATSSSGSSGAGSKSGAVSGRSSAKEKDPK